MLRRLAVSTASYFLLLVFGNVVVADGAQASSAALFVTTAGRLGAVGVGLPGAVIVYRLSGKMRNRILSTEQMMEGVSIKFGSDKALR